jgi:hypothetical protein
MLPILEHSIDEEAAEVLSKESARRVLTELLRALDGLTGITAAVFLRVLDGVGKATTSSKRSVFLFARAAITGKLEGAELGAVAELLGAQELRSRIGRSLRHR